MTAEAQTLIDKLWRAHQATELLRAVPRGPDVRDDRLLDEIDHALDDALTGLAAQGRTNPFDRVVVDCVRARALLARLRAHGRS